MTECGVSIAGIRCTMDRGHEGHHANPPRKPLDRPEFWTQGPPSALGATPYLDQDKVNDYITRLEGERDQLKQWLATQKHTADALRNRVKELEGALGGIDKLTSTLIKRGHNSPRTGDLLIAIRDPARQALNQHPSQEGKR